jgi:uncharacterized membrane protein YfcA
MTSDQWLYVWLGICAFAAAMVNSVAGGGTLLSFPPLLAVTESVIANATSTVALAPGSLAGAWGYKSEFTGLRRWLLLLTPPSIVGGIIGSVLVSSMPSQYFDALIPWLILAATLLFLLQPLLSKWTKAGHHDDAKPGAIATIIVFQFFVAIYGGYFGAGIGILMLSSLGLMGMRNIHAMNALKNFLAFCINGVSIFVFVIQDVVDWRFAAVMAPAAALGAYTGARVAQRLNRRLVRWIVIFIGFALAGHFFYQRWYLPEQPPH